MRVLVVGLNPSRKHNNNPSLKRLYGWLDELHLKTVSFINLYEDYEIAYKTEKTEFIQSISKDYDKIIALGSQVSRALSNVDIEHFKLPHPSGRNRQLNDPGFVHKELKACKNWLKG